MERGTMRKVAVAAVLVLVATVAVVLVVRTRKGPVTVSGDRCSRDAEPADGGTTVDLGGLRMQVPKGWYDVPVCFATAAMVQPAGYVTSQSPVAQCRPDRQGQVGCGPPVAELGDGDVLLVASTVMRSAVPKLRAMTTVAGLPAEQHFVRPGSQGERFINLSVLVTPDEVLQLTAYAGNHAGKRRNQLWDMIQAAKQTSPRAVSGQVDPDNRLTFAGPRGRHITIVPTNLRCGLATYRRNHQRAVKLELQRNVDGRYLDILRVEALLVSRPTTYRLPVSAGSVEQGARNASLYFSRTDFRRHRPFEVFSVSTADEVYPRRKPGVLQVLEASCNPARLHLEIHAVLGSQLSDAPDLHVSGGVDLIGY